MPLKWAFLTSTKHQFQWSLLLVSLHSATDHHHSEQQPLGLERKHRRENIHVVRRMFVLEVLATSLLRINSSPSRPSSVRPTWSKCNPFLFLHDIPSWTPPKLPTVHESHLRGPGFLHQLDINRTPTASAWYPSSTIPSCPPGSQ